MDNSEKTVGQFAPDFELPGVDGSVHHLARYLERFQTVGVVIMCNHCPFVRSYLERLKQIQADFQPQGMTLIGINPNDDQQFPEDSFDRMKTFAIEQALNFPYLRDVTQDVAQSFGAEKTPEVFLIDRACSVRYRGAIDDNTEAASVKQSYLRNAITQLLAGRDISPVAVPAVGCSVKWRM